MRSAVGGSACSSAARRLSCSRSTRSRHWPARVPSAPVRSARRARGSGRRAGPSPAPAPPAARAPAPADLQHHPAITQAAQQAAIGQPVEVGPVGIEHAAAAALSRPPAEAPRATNRLRSLSSSSARLQSIVARSVRWRSGASRGPPVASSRTGRPAAFLDAHHTDRAAASSIASGRDSIAPPRHGPPGWERSGGRAHARERRTARRRRPAPAGPLRLHARRRCRGGPGWWRAPAGRSSRQHDPDGARGVQDLLEIVEDQQRVAVTELGDELPFGIEVQRPRDLGRHRSRLAGREVDEVRAIGKVLEQRLAGPQRQPGLARQARSRSPVEPGPAAERRSPRSHALARSAASGVRGDCGAAGESGAVAPGHRRIAACSSRS